MVTVSLCSRLSARVLSLVLSILEVVGLGRYCQIFCDRSFH